MLLHTEFVVTYLQAKLGLGADRRERGASLVEYALLLALIAIVCIVAVTAFGTSVSDSFDDTNSSMFVTPN